MRGVVTIRLGSNELGEKREKGCESRLLTPVTLPDGADFPTNIHLSLLSLYGKKKERSRSKEIGQFDGVGPREHDQEKGENRRIRVD